MPLPPPGMKKRENERGKWERASSSFQWEIEKWRDGEREREREVERGALCLLQRGRMFDRSGVGRPASRQAGTRHAAAPRDCVRASVDDKESVVVVVILVTQLATGVPASLHLSTGNRGVDSEG